MYILNLAFLSPELHSIPDNINLITDRDCKKWQINKLQKLGCDVGRTSALKLSAYSINSNF